MVPRSGPRRILKSGDVAGCGSGLSWEFRISGIQSPKGTCTHTVYTCCNLGTLGSEYVLYGYMGP